MNRKVKQIQKDVNKLKTMGNIYDNYNNSPELVDTQKKKPHFKETSRQNCKELLNKLEIWVNKMKKKNNQRTLLCKMS